MVTVEEILDYVTQQEDRYYELAGKAIDKNNNMGSILHSAEASAFQRVRYFIEIGIEETEGK